MQQAEEDQGGTHEHARAIGEDTDDQGPARDGAMGAAPVELVVVEVVLLLGAEERVDRVLPAIVVLLGLGFRHEIGDLLIGIEPLRADAPAVAAKRAGIKEIILPKTRFQEDKSYTPHITLVSIASPTSPYHLNF